LSYETALHEGGILSNETALLEGTIPVAVSDIIFYFKNFVVFCCNGGSQDSLVSLSSMLQTVRSGVRIPIRARDFSFLQSIQTGSGTHPASYSMVWGVLSGGRGSKAFGM
jgi:hypothetical protein